MLKPKINKSIKKQIAKRKKKEKGNYVFCCITDRLNKKALNRGQSFYKRPTKLSGIFVNSYIVFPTYFTENWYLT